MKKLYVGLLLMASFTLFGLNLSPVAAAADNCSGSGSFLGFVPWYRGITQSDANGCGIKAPGSGEGDITKFIWTIVLNILDNLFVAVGYASLFFIIWGGFKYMTSTGSADGMSKAKTTIMNAVIGLVISIVSVAVVTFIIGGFYPG